MEKEVGQWCEVRGCWDMCVACGWSRFYFSVRWGLSNRPDRLFSRSLSRHRTNVLIITAMSSIITLMFSFCDLSISFQIIFIS